MAPHSSTLAWKIPWTEEPGRLQSMGSLRVGHDCWLHFHFSLLCIGEGNGNPLQCSCLENPRDGGAWWAAVYGVTQSWTWLKGLSSSSSIHLRRNRAQLFATPWTILYSPWNSPGRNTGVDSSSFPLQGIFPTQGSNLGLPSLQADSLLAEPQGNPKNSEMCSPSLLQ